MQSITSFLPMQILKDWSRSAVLVRSLPVAEDMLNHGTHKLVRRTIQAAADLEMTSVGQ